MSSINSIFGSSFDESFDFQGFSSGAMDNHNRHSHSRSRERSPHERSSRNSNREERRQSQENRPENVQDRHHYPYLPHLVPREAERPPAGRAKALKIHNDRILLSHQPLLLPQSRILLQLPGTNKIYTFCTQKSFRTAAWTISGKDLRSRISLGGVRAFSSPHGEKALEGNMRALGDRGVAGVALGRLIVFQHLSKTS